MTTAAIGIDFGATNSSIALAHFPYMGEVTAVYRSLLYLEQIKEAPKSFHEKAGECQAVLSFFLSSSLFLLLHIVPIQPSRLCRHPSIRTLC